MHCICIIRVYTKYSYCEGNLKGVFLFEAESLFAVNTRIKVIYLKTISV